MVASAKANVGKRRTHATAQNRGRPRQTERNESNRPPFSPGSRSLSRRAATLRTMRSAYFTADKQKAQEKDPNRTSCAFTGV